MRRGPSVSLMDNITPDRTQHLTTRYKAGQCILALMILATWLFLVLT